MTGGRVRAGGLRLGGGRGDGGGLHTDDVLPGPH